jgi:hypothetical protein
VGETLGPGQKPLESALQGRDTVAKTMVMFLRWWAQTDAYQTLAKAQASAGLAAGGATLVAQAAALSATQAAARAMAAAGMVECTIRGPRGGSIGVVLTSSTDITAAASAACETLGLQRRLTKGVEAHMQRVARTIGQHTHPKAATAPPGARAPGAAEQLLGSSRGGGASSGKWWHCTGQESDGEDGPDYAAGRAAGGASITRMELQAARYATRAHTAASAASL